MKFKTCNKCNKEIKDLNDLEQEELNNEGCFVCSDCINEEMNNDSIYFKELQQENDRLRAEIFLLLNEFMPIDERDSILNKINALIENEIEQESYCNN